MIKKLKSGIRHRKARVFLIFLACSFGAWLISRLSQTYSHTVEFNIIYTHLPENRVLMDPPPPEMGVRIRANGFQLLGYQLSPRTVEIDLRNARETRKGSYISPQAYREQMERQFLSRVLQRGDGCRRRAAERLQLPYSTLKFRLRKLKITSPEQR